MRVDGNEVALLLVDDSIVKAVKTLCRALSEPRDVHAMRDQEITKLLERHVFLPRAVWGKDVQSFRRKHGMLHASLLGSTRNIFRVQLRDIQPAFHWRQLRIDV
eukprot:CAMPEP_0170652298 /NCGR_PEP_ID=MMETSP0224-20130122/46830_1 /TAXON_ID=285029 /ORGANISM="Togula jolla, Strain CCCM 725" /LENGTH=103 /DNA_ID=CAMNT_0010984155 /DNA_START=158 /DNA_END=469 /DNA_ORIENTATION=-